MVQAVMQAMGSDGELRQMTLHSLAHRSPSSCAAQFLTGCVPVPVHGLGVGDPCYKASLVYSRFPHNLSNLMWCALFNRAQYSVGQHKTD